MRAAFDDPRLRFVIGDVRDRQRLVQAMRDIEIVVHAAALKRVEVCEADPCEAKKTNIDGSEHVALAAIECGVHLGVMLSTDKAASPNTLYGATKLTAERLWNGANVYAAGTRTRFACTRYGNVINSTGSVVPLWRSQAAAGLPVTITDNRMTRFLMTMDDAVTLVLVALHQMRGGEVFVPEVGAASMVDLATIIAPHAVKREVGIRPGEKLHETLITADEARSTYAANGYYVIEPPLRSWETIPPPPYPLVADGWSYWSDTARQLSGDELRAMVAL